MRWEAKEKCINLSEPRVASKDRADTDSLSFKLIYNYFNWITIIPISVFFSIIFSSFFYSLFVIIVFFHEALHYDAHAFDLYIRVEWFVRRQSHTHNRAQRMNASDISHLISLLPTLIHSFYRKMDENLLWYNLYRKRYASFNRSHANVNEERKRANDRMKREKKITESKRDHVHHYGNSQLKCFSRSTFLWVRKIIAMW